MRSNRLVNLMLVLLILSLFFIVQPVNAEDNIENQIEADFNIELKSATDLKISITMDVSTILLTASGVSYNKEDIQSVTNPETMGAIKYALKSYLTGQIKQTFENADISFIIKQNPL